MWKNSRVNGEIKCCIKQQQQQQQKKIGGWSSVAKLLLGLLGYGDRSQRDYPCSMVSIGFKADHYIKYDKR